MLHFQETFTSKMSIIYIEILENSDKKFSQHTIPKLFWPMSYKVIIAMSLIWIYVLNNFSNIVSR